MCQPWLPRTTCITAVGRQDIAGVVDGGDGDRVVAVEQHLDLPNRRANVICSVELGC